MLSGVGWIQPNPHLTAHHAEWASQLREWATQLREWPTYSAGWLSRFSEDSFSRTRAHVYDSEREKYMTLVTLVPMADFAWCNIVTCAVGTRGTRVT